LPRQQVERRLRSEWLRDNYADVGYWEDFPLGQAPGNLPTQASTYPWRRKVDGLVIGDREILLIEFKVWKPLDGLDKLQTYKALVPLTPELYPYRDYKVRMLLVTPRPTPPLAESALAAGIELVEVHSDWMDQVVERIEWLWTAEGRQAMEERKRLRSWLGLD